MSGGHGSATLVSYWDGTGVLRIAGSGFAPSTSLPVVIYTGSCTSPSILVRFQALTSDASGGAVGQISVGLSASSEIWGVARTGRIGLRIGGSTGPAACGWLTYAVATRVAIPSLGINLPVIRQPGGFPPCNVGMYLAAASQPREAGVTFIYGHSRKGTFLPLLTRSKVRNGASLIGLAVRVWTSDSVLSTYRITKVRRHQKTFGGMFGITREELWIQASEGPRGWPYKLIVVAKRVSSARSSYAAAHPAPRPAVCR